MKTRILDKAALTTISSAALMTYARNEGWSRTDSFGDYADIYSGDGRPEILVPRTESVADYASVVSRLIGIFSEVTEQNELTIYRDLVAADHDVVRVSALGAEDDGSVLLEDGVELVSQARNMLLAAACSARTPRPFYRAGANRDAVEYMKRVRLAQTEHGSFVIALLAPAARSARSSSDGPIDSEPNEWPVTRCLVQALKASREAANTSLWEEGEKKVEWAISQGVSANLCEAVASLLEKWDRLEIGVSWAKVGSTPEKRSSIEFSESDAVVYREMARVLRTRISRTAITLHGSVHRLKRARQNTLGQVTFKVKVEGVSRSVSAVLNQRNYSIALRAHDKRRQVVVTGDLEQVGQRWRLTNASVRERTRADDSHDY